MRARGGAPLPILRKRATDNTLAQVRGQSWRQSARVPALPIMRIARIHAHRYRLWVTTPPLSATDYAYRRRATEYALVADATDYALLAL